MNDNQATRKINFIEERYEDGVLTSSRTGAQLPKEPPFVKLYLKDLAHMRNLPAWVSGILYELLKKMDYSNEIVLNSTVKNRIAGELGIHHKTIDNALVKFVSKKIFFRLGKGVFQANPYIFGRGSWGEVEKIRLTVSYSADGEKHIEAEILTNEEVSREEVVEEERMMNANTHFEGVLRAEREEFTSVKAKVTRTPKVGKNKLAGVSLFSEV
jgi:hypothetical protein